MLPDDRMSNVASILARLIEVRKRQSGGSWRVHGARGHRDCDAAIGRSCWLVTGRVFYLASVLLDKYTRIWYTGVRVY